MMIARQQGGGAMRRALVAALMIWAGAAAAQDAAPEAAIRGVIGDQITALRADDFATAFGFASPLIRDMFGTPETFGAMVRQGYPMVHRPADIRWLPLREQAGQTIQRVMIRDAAGRVHFLDYEMVRAGNGWQINGVRIVPPEGAGA